MSNLEVYKFPYSNEDAIDKVINYFYKETDYYGNKKSILLRGGCGIIEGNKDIIITSFKKIKEIHKKEDGKQLHHFVIGIDEKHLTTNEERNRYAIDVAYDVSGLIYDLGFQNYYCVHYDYEGSHIHFCVNSINYKNGKRIAKEQSFYNQIRRFIIEYFPFLHIKEVYYQQSNMWRYEDAYYLEGIHNKK